MMTIYKLLCLVLANPFRCSATKDFDTAPWLSFDLQKIYLLKTIMILNRKGTLGE